MLGVEVPDLNRRAERRAISGSKAVYPVQGDNQSAWNSAESEEGHKRHMWRPRHRDRLLTGRWAVAETTQSGMLCRVYNSAPVIHFRGGGADRSGPGWLWLSRGRDRGPHTRRRWCAFCSREDQKCRSKTGWAHGLQTDHDAHQFHRGYLWYDVLLTSDLCLLLFLQALMGMSEWKEKWMFILKDITQSTTQSF